MTTATVEFHSISRTTVRASVNDAVLGMRGASVMLIGMTHYLPTQVFSFNIARPLSSFMLVATGYFWAAQMNKEAGLSSAEFTTRAQSLWRLLVHRHLRIWPVLAVTIFGYVVLGVLDGGDLTRQILWTWPLYLTYLGNVPKYLFEGNAFPSHFWLISSQEQVVLAVGLAVLLLGYARLTYALMPLLLLGVTGRSIGALLFMPDHTAIALDTPIAVLDSVAIGFLLHAALAHRAHRTRIRLQLGALGIAGLAIWATLPNISAIYFGLMPFIAAIWGAFFLVLATDNLRAPNFATTFIGWPPLVHCGKIALSLFLVHPLINTILILVYPLVVGDTIPWPLFVTVGPATAFLAANALYLTVEAPAKNLRRANAGAVRTEV